MAIKNLQVPEKPEERAALKSKIESGLKSGKLSLEQEQAARIALDEIAHAEKKDSGEDDVPWTARARQYPRAHNALIAQEEAGLEPNENPSPEEIAREQGIPPEFLPERKRDLSAEEKQEASAEPIKPNTDPHRE